MNETQIVMYGTNWCPDCVRSKRVLEKHGISFKWVDIEDDKDAMTYVLKVNKGHRVVPTLVFRDGSVLIEPSNKDLEAKLNGL